ncbi:hypothetical protein V9T40_013348 [Parthenolecanium corni]|uniref:Borealin C-terminal domain-containing protein n=1 Tax=Parthenolecanium corni TaxID=536013 RepID=A0AAN9TL77_9HEMI
MPRTKIPKKRRVTDLCDEPVETLSLDQKIREIEEDIRAAKVTLRVKHSKLLMSMKRFYADARFQINTSGLKSITLGELMKAENKENLATNFSNNGAAPTSLVKPKSVQRSLRKRSNSCSTRSATKRHQEVRSNSCDRSNRNAFDSATKFKTPLNRGIPQIQMVTPKINPNQPVSVLRRPKQGEFAMSLTGSPLMVSNVVSDSMVSVSIPLPDGRVLSILPTEGIDAANLSIDEETRDQLMRLRSNLTKCLQK